MQGGWKRVIAALGSVDHIIWMKYVSPRKLVSQRGDDFIEIHVGLCAGSRLPDRQRKLIPELSVQESSANMGNGCFLERSDDA